VGTKDGQIYNGADDNGSGTCGMLALAEALKAHGPLRRSVLLIWVSGEEKGLWGSEAWNAAPWLPEGARAVADINIDMIGRNDPDELFITPSRKLGKAYNGLVRLAERLAPSEGFGPLKNADAYYRRSDHYNFIQAGIPAAFLFADVHEDYHKPTDTVDKIDFDKIRRVTRLVMRMLSELQADELDI
jgi:Zn-dependent M28 family amino/carboxypeptidase